MDKNYNFYKTDHLIQSAYDQVSRLILFTFLIPDPFFKYLKKPLCEKISQYGYFIAVIKYYMRITLVYFFIGLQWTKRTKSHPVACFD